MSTEKLIKVYAKAFIDRMKRTLVKHFEVTRNEGVDIPDFTEWVLVGFKEIGLNL